MRLKPKHGKLLSNFALKFNLRHYILVLPVAVLDAVFILWIFTALSKTLAQLQARAQHSSTSQLNLSRACH
jgi:hypothetical protein